MVRSAAAANRSGGASENHIVRWYTSLPICTRIVLTGLAIFTLGAGRLISPFLLPLYWPLVWGRFEIWRLATAFLWEELKINGLLRIFFFYRDSLDLETQEFGGRTADYAWFLMVCMGLIASVSWITHTVVLTKGLQLAVVTLWSLHRAEQIVSFFMGFRFPAAYLPYVVMALDYVANHGATPYAMIYGWIAARVYYYLVVDLPARGGINYIPTPQFLYRIFGPVNTIGAGPSATASTTGPQTYQRPGGGHYWGSGRRLG
ncbi:DER1-domain-containing protein [Martensiomyces pterosporus]|nr:DER1-domain-containing protein [Martensiomyces pterosporus]